MNASELRTLCTALGFTALASKEGGTVNAGRAKALALLIEEFCRANEKAEQGALHTIWSSAARDGFVALEAQDMTGNKTMIAELRAKTGADQTAVASAIVTALNESARKDALIAELTACLEMCLDADASPQRVKRTNKI